MELIVWKGDFHLPSVDVDSIHALAFARIAKIPLKVSYCTNPYFTSHGKYPILKNEYGSLSNLTKILDFFRSECYNADFSLSSKNCSESYAFAKMIEDKLQPVMEFLLWYDRRNCDELIAPWFIKNMLTPFGYYYTRKCRSFAKDYIEMKYPKVRDQEVLQAYVKNLAVDIFSMLSMRLGKKKFFYGEDPTSLDACVYSYLSILVKMPFKSKEIPNLIETWPELAEFVKRFDAKFFPELMEDNIQKDNLERLKMAEDEFATPLATKIFALFVASAAMLGFAVSKNIVNIDTIRSFIPIGEK